MKERRNSLFVVGYFALGLFGGWLIGSIEPIKGIAPEVINAEYYIELRPDGSAIIEDCGGNTIVCPLDSIPAVLLRDNL